jgi:hypothetical protein
MRRNEWRGRENMLTPDLVRKAEAVNDRGSDQQIALFEFAFLHFGSSSDIEGGDVGCYNRGARIFHATSTHVQTSRLGRLTRINVAGFLLGLREGVIRVQTLEGGCSTGGINETSTETLEEGLTSVDHDSRIKVVFDHLVVNPDSSRTLVVHMAYIAEGSPLATTFEEHFAELVWRRVVLDGISIKRVDWECSFEYRDRYATPDTAKAGCVVVLVNQINTLQG